MPFPIRILAGTLLLGMPGVIQAQSGPASTLEAFVEGVHYRVLSTQPTAHPSLTLIFSFLAPDLTRIDASLTSIEDRLNAEGIETRRLLTTRPATLLGAAQAHLARALALAESEGVSSAFRSEVIKHLSGREGAPFVDLVPEVRDLALRAGVSEEGYEAQMMGIRIQQQLAAHHSELESLFRLRVLEPGDTVKLLVNGCFEIVLGALGDPATPASSERLASLIHGLLLRTS